MKKQPEKTDATRKAMFDAFWTVYQRKSIDKITIREIVDVANVHRSSFYRYFSDIYDLRSQLEQKIISEISANLKILNTQDFTDLISHADSMVIALKEYAPLICHLTGPNGDVNFRSMLREQMRLNFSIQSIGKISSLATEYLLSFMFSCILSNLNFWYEHREECSLEQICSMSMQMISGGLIQFVRSMEQ